MNKGLSKQGTGCKQNDSELIRCAKEQEEVRALEEKYISPTHVEI